MLIRPIQLVLVLLFLFSALFSEAFAEPEIEVSNNILTFGSEIENVTVFNYFNITNIGTEYLEIHSISSSNMVFSPTPFNAIIHSGKSLTIQVAFTPTAVQEYVEFIEISSNAGDKIISVSGTGVSDQPMNIDSNDTDVPVEYELGQNFPNPFNPTTTIAFTVPEQSAVTLTVFDMLGQKVTTLVDEVMSSGSYSVNWNAADRSSGIYFYTLKSGDITVTRRMTLIK